MQTLEQRLKKMAVLSAIIENINLQIAAIQIHPYEKRAEYEAMLRERIVKRQQEMQEV